MRRLDFRLVNVFAAEGKRLSGNALAVFEDATRVTDGEMAALALQLNLAETTFLLPPERGGAAKVRIFTPTTEMPFAGHPTLGSGFVARALDRGGDDLVLEMKAGDVHVRAVGDHFQLTAPSAPRRRDVGVGSPELEAILGLSAGSVLAGSAWIHTGVEQLVVPLASPEAVASARPDPAQLARVGAGTRGEACMYVFAERAPGVIVARFFYLAFGAVVEDPATGSACANLGGFFVLSGRTELDVRVEQGDAVARPSRLRLVVRPREGGSSIHVGGDVVEIGRGQLAI